MKKSFLVLALLAGTILSLSAAEIKMPVLWKAKIAKTPGMYQTMAFAYKADKEKLYFAWQVKDLMELVREDNPSMACYFNVDNDRMTGRFPKACGWDLQFNIRLHLANPQLIHWVGNKGTTLKYKKGEVTSRIAGDIFLLTVKKSVLKALSFKETFVARSFQGFKGCKTRIIGMENAVVSPAKKVGEMIIKD